MEIKNKWINLVGLWFEHSPSALVGHKLWTISTTNASVEFVFCKEIFRGSMNTIKVNGKWTVEMSKCRCVWAPCLSEYDMYIYLFCLFALFALTHRVGACCHSKSQSGKLFIACALKTLQWSKPVWFWNLKISQMKIFRWYYKLISSSSTHIILENIMPQYFVTAHSLPCSPLVCLPIGDLQSWDSAVSWIGLFHND